MDKTCSAIAKSGERCRGKLLPGKRFCFSHDPEIAERRSQGQRTGGHRKSLDFRLRRDLLNDRLEPGQVEGLISGALVATSSGSMPPGTLSALAAGVRAYVAIRQGAELEERLEALEAHAGINERKSA